MKARLTIWLLFIPAFLFAQSEEKSHKALNNYVLFVNQNIQTLSFFHQKFEFFNLRLNNYYQTSPIDSLGRLTKETDGVSLTFASIQAKASLSSLYEQTIEESKCLNATNAQKLNQTAERLMNQVYKLLKINASIEEYIKQKKYLGEADLIFPYQKLNEARVLFHDFAIIKEELEQEIAQVGKQYASLNANTHYRPHFKFWRDNILLNSHGLIYGVKKDVSAESLQFAQSIEKNLEGLPELKKQLKFLKKTNKSTYKVLIQQYDKMENIAKSLVEIGKNFPLELPMGAEEQLFGKAHSTFSQKALPEYNQLVEEYSILNKLLGSLELFAMKEVPWFKFLPADTKWSNEDGSNSVLAGALPNHLVFLLDVSGSMEAADRLPLLQKSLKYLVTQMRPTDRISIVTYSGNAKIILEAATVNEQKKIFKVIDRLRSDGKTNLLSGLQMAYKLLDKNFIRNGNNRVVMATDGGFGRSELSEDLIAQEAFHQKPLTILYFGNQELRYKTDLVALSKKGNGNYVHVRPENANEALIQEAKTQ